MLEPLDAADGPHFSTRRGEARLRHDGRGKSFERPGAGRKAMHVIATGILLLSEVLVVKAGSKKGLVN